MLVMVSCEMMTGAGIFVTFPVDTVENGRLVTVTGEDVYKRQSIMYAWMRIIVDMELARQW